MPKSAAEQAELIRSKILEDIPAAERDTTAVVEKCLEMPSPAPSRATGFVDEVAVQGIRSFGPARSIRFSESLTVVYAGNGTGKTSFVDALELLVEGETSRSEAHPLAESEVKDKDHIPHKTPDGAISGQHSPGVTVKWALVPGGAIQEATWKGEYGQPAVAAPDIQLIARRRLRQVVSARPSDRLARLGPSLGLGELNDTWGAVHKHLREPWFDRPPRTMVDLVAARLLTEAPVSASQASLRTWIRAWAEDQQASFPSSVRVTEGPPLGPYSAEWNKLAQRYLEHEQSTPAPVAEISADMVAMFDQLMRVANPGETCPACADATLSASRIAEIRHILRGLTEHQNHAAEATRLRNQTEDLYRKLQVLDLTWDEQPFELSENGTDSSLLDDAISWRDAAGKLEQIRMKSAEQIRSETIQSVADLAVRLEETKAHIDTNVPNLNAEAEAVGAGLRRVPPEHVATALKSLDAVAEKIEEVREQARLNDLSGQAAKAVKALLQQRAESVVAELAASINDWLSLLAPAGTPAIKLAVQPSAGVHRLSIRIGNTVNSTHALGYLSDAQVDMLGMAAHFARIERDHPRAVVVVDDPSDMLDSATRKKFATEGIRRLLEDQNGGLRQVVVLTHDDMLVRELWDAHRGMKPAMVQDNIEVHRAADDSDMYSEFVPRGLDSALERTRALLGDNGLQHHRDRLWFRAALAAQTRVCVEMYAKQLAELLGPGGLSRLQSVPEKQSLDSVANQVVRELNDIIAGACLSPRHDAARTSADEARDLLSGWAGSLLNPGAHADVVLPEVADSKNIVEKLKNRAKELAPPSGAPRSDWVTESRFAKSLISAINCTKPCPGAS